MRCTSDLLPLTTQEKTGQGCLSLCLCVAAVVEGSTLSLIVSVTSNVSVICVCLCGFVFIVLFFFWEGDVGGEIVWVFFTVWLYFVYKN